MVSEYFIPCEFGAKSTGLLQINNLKSGAWTNWNMIVSCERYACSLYVWDAVISICVHSQEVVLGRSLAMSVV